MPSKTEKQRKYVYFLRGKYKTKKDTPEKYKWVWNDEWLKVEEMKLKKYNPLKFINEDITIPLNRGDSFKFGKFKNKTAVYDSHYFNDKGDLIIVTPSGKEIPASKIRLMSEELFLKDFKKHAGTSDFTKDWIEIRRKIRGAGNKSAKFHSIKINRRKDYIDIIFKSIPTYSGKERSVNVSSMTLNGNVKAYTQTIRVLDFFKYAETKPNYNEAELTNKEVKEVLNVCPVKVECNCGSFTFQGLSFYLTQLDGAIIDNNITPEVWNKYHDRKGDLGIICKHLSMIFNSIDFFLNPITSVINKYLKKH